MKLRFITVLLLVFTLLTPAIAQQAITYRSPEVLNPLPLGKPSAIFAANDGSACLVLQDLDPNEVWRKVSADLVEVTKPTIPFRLGLTTYKVLTVTSQGNVITDRDGISIYSPLGERLQTITFGANGGALLGVDGATVLPDGRTVVLVDNRLQVFSANGTFVTTWGNGKGTGAGFLDVIGTDWSPGLLVSDSKGNVYVSDKNNRRISKWSVTGNFEGAIKLDNLSNPIFWSTGQLAVDANDSIYCVDKNQSCIVKVSAQLSLLWKVSTVGAVDSTLRAPAGVAVVGSSVFVSEAMSHRISKYSTDGNHKSSSRSLVYLPTWPIAGASFVDIPDASLYFTKFTNPDVDQVSRISEGKKSAWVKVSTIDNGSFVQFRNGAGQRLLRSKSGGVTYSLDIYSGDATKLGNVSLNFARSGNGNGSSWAISDGNTISTVDSTGAILSTKSGDGVSPWANVVACATLSSGVVVAIDYDRSTILLLSPQLQVLKSTSFSEVGLSKGIALAVGLDDSIFVLGYLTGGTKVVSRLKSDLSFIQQIKLTGLHQDHISLGGIDVSPDLSLVVTDPEGHQIYFYSTDTSSPVSTITILPSSNEFGWMNKPATVRLLATDGLGWGVKYIHYQIDNGAVIDSPGNQVEFTVSNEGAHTVRYWSEDYFNNVEVARTKTFKLDAVAPLTKLTELGTSISLIASDTNSGVRGTYYQVDGEPINTYIGQIPANFGTLIYWSDDYAGNSEVRRTYSRQPKLKAVEVLPSKLIGGGRFVVRVSLESITNPGGYEVQFTSDNPGLLVTLPSSVMIPTGQTFVEVSVGTTSVTSIKNITLTASAYRVSKSAVVQITPPSMTSFSMSPTAIASLGVTLGKVTLNGIAPVGGLVISIKSVGPVKVPTSVVVPEGQDQVTFPVEALVVQSLAVAEVTVNMNAQAIKNNINVFPYDLIQLTINPSSVFGGQSASLTAELSSPASAGGVTLQLSNSNSAILTVPASIVIPSGQTKVTVQINSKSVKADQVAEVSATGPISKRKVIVTVRAPTLATFSLSPDVVVGGQTSTAMLSITSAAPAGGTIVSLSSDSSLVAVPATVSIPEGKTSVTFLVPTLGVTADSDVILSAFLLGQSVEVALAIKAPRIKSIDINPTKVYGGAKISLTVTLDSVTKESVSVTLSSSGNGLVLPSDLVISAGSDSRTIQVDTLTVDRIQQVTVFGQRLDNVKSTTVEILPTGLKSLSISPNRVWGGNSVTGRIELMSPVGPSGLFVNISSSVQGVAVPNKVFIDPGLSQYDFSIGTVEVSDITKCEVSVTSNSETVGSRFDILPPKLGTLESSQSSFAKPASGKITLVLSAPFTSDAKISIVSNNAAVKLQSAFITIKKGQTSGSVTFTTLSVFSDQDCEIKGTYRNREVSTTISVLSPRPVSLTLNPAVVIGGKSSTGTASISYPAPKEGFSVSVTSKDSSAVVPSFVLVPSGKTTATFTITTSKVTASKDVVITASANGTEKTASLGVRILTVASITFNPTSIQGGSKSNGLLNLTSVAPVGGLTVTLSSDKTGVTVPTILLVPAGKNSVAFVASTSVTASSYDATITGTANGETGSGKLKVLAPAVSSFTLSSVSVKGGEKPLATVKIAKASSVDVVVELSSSNTSVASLPATVTIPKGQLLATFQVTTTKPSVATSVTLSATTGGLAKVVVLKVSP